MPIERRYTPEFKQSVLDALDGGMSREEVLRKFDLKKNTLYAWSKKGGRQRINKEVALARSNARTIVAASVGVPPSPRTATPDLEDKVHRLEKENALLRRLIDVYQSAEL